MRIVLPCNMDRLLWNAKKLFRINTRKTTDLNPVNVVEGVKCGSTRLTSSCHMGCNVRFVTITLL